MNIELNEKNLETVDEYNRQMKIALSRNYDTEEFTAASKALVDIRVDLSIIIVSQVSTQRFHQCLTAVIEGNINIKDVEDLVVMQVDSTDYPDFTDACWESGVHKILGRDLTEDELDGLGQNYPEELSEAAMESLR